jgi:hypothetical protein
MKRVLETRRDTDRRARNGGLYAAAYSGLAMTSAIARSRQARGTFSERLEIASSRRSSQ